MAAFSSPYFQIQELAEGVYAVLGDQDGLCHSNAGIIDLGDRTLVIDTLALPSYGASLADASRALTRRDPSWVALTHHHADHWLGNQAFDRAIPLLATPDMMLPLDDSMNGYQGAIEDPSGFEGQVDDYAAAVESEEDAETKASMTINLGQYRALLAELPSIQLIRPNTLFEGTLTLTGSKRSVELKEIKNAHTASDVYVALPDEGILFMGDLGFFDSVPFLGFATPLRWIDVLKEFEGSDVTSFVPGHGIVAGPDKVAESRACIEAVVEVVRAAMVSGEEITGELSERLPQPFRTWGAGSPFMQMSFERVKASLQAT